MVINPTYRLARLEEAPMIAEMSREHIEYGLRWSWTSARVRKAISDKFTNVVIAHDHDDDIFGFGIMRYAIDGAHLQLLCVHELHRRRGIGTNLVHWLEKCAETGGCHWLQVEARADNSIAHSFYKKLDYKLIAKISGYYSGKQDAVRLMKKIYINSTV
jgi:ribosomal protein S18 acetylase RimI-like enzyme